ncbi:MAG: PspC domain-containing protein [Chloroflexota bacterium]|nr:PspC domain-containing protein [Chloroflexota bacterium]
MTEQKKLYRDTANGMIGGVCAGWADYFTVGPTIVRLLFVFLTLAGFSGVLIYLIKLLVVPAK